MSQPRLDFLIGGVQKGGTTALAYFLSRHPQVELPRQKEAHIFDASDFDDGQSVEQIDSQYAAHFDAEFDEGFIFGDATPIYCFQSVFVERIARYNPKIKWVLLLRHPVDRAMSQYQMERRRGFERFPFLLAILLEHWRIRGRETDLSPNSPLRHHSYRARGDYAVQLDNLYSLFPREQVLLVRNEDLLQDPVRTLGGIADFLQLEPFPVSEGRERIFEGNYPALMRGGYVFRFVSWLMRREISRAADVYGLDWK